MNKFEAFRKELLKKDIPEFRPGYTVEVHQKIKEKGKERVQIFEGIVIARKHGASAEATFTVRKIASGVGVERIFPLHSQHIAKIKVVKRAKPRRAKLYYLRRQQREKMRQEERVQEAQTKKAKTVKQIVRQKNENKKPAALIKAKNQAEAPQEAKTKKTKAGSKQK